MWHRRSAVCVDWSSAMDWKRPGALRRGSRASIFGWSARCQHPLRRPVVEEYILEKGESTIILRVVTSGIPDSPDWDGFVEGTREGRVVALYGLRHYLE